LDAINKKVENTTLSDNEINMKHYLKEKIASLIARRRDEVV